MAATWLKDFDLDALLREFQPQAAAGEVASDSASSMAETSQPHATTGQPHAAEAAAAEPQATTGQPQAAKSPAPLPHVGEADSMFAFIPV